MEIKKVAYLLLLFLVLNLYFSSEVNAAPIFENRTSERDVNNISTGIIPPAIIQEPSETDDFFNKLKGFLSFLGYLNPLNFFSGSESLQQANVPTEFKTESPDSTSLDSNGAKDQVDNFLGGSTGFFGSSLPKELTESDANAARKTYEKANLPKEILP